MVFLGRNKFMGFQQRVGIQENRQELHEKVQGHHQNIYPILESKDIFDWSVFINRNWAWPYN